MMYTIPIREASEADVPAILDIYRNAGIGGLDNFNPAEAADHFAAITKNHSFRIYVAIGTSQIVGTYELLIMDNLAKRGMRSGIVEDVAVHLSFQGRGIGRAMMAHAIEECRKAGCYKVTLSSNVARPDAHAFYKSVGFELHGYSFLCMNRV